MCPYNGIQAKKLNEVVFDESKLKLLGFVLCEGNDEERADELFDIIHEGGQNFISSRDRRFRELFEVILQMATEVVFEHEAQIFGRQPHSAVTADSIAAARERYHDLYIHFLDQVFSYDATLPKYEWVENVVCKQNWILHSKEIRKMLFGESIMDQE